MTNLFDPPDVYVLPLVKGQDLVVDFQKVDDDGNPVDYTEDESVQLVIDTDPATTADAEINGNHAVCRVESTVSDAITKPVPWRCVVSTAGDPSTETVPCNGKTKRFDS